MCSRERENDGSEVFLVKARNIVIRLKMAKITERKQKQLTKQIESLDTNQLEAAKDLGSSTFRTHWRIVIPHAKAGIASGCTMVFMLTAGALATPVVLSSPNTYWFTQLIYQWFNMNDNWSRGSAYSILLLTVSVIFVLLMMRLFKVKIGEIIR